MTHKRAGGRDLEDGQDLGWGDPCIAALLVSFLFFSRV